MRLRKRTAIIAACIAAMIPLSASVAAPVQAQANTSPGDFQIDSCQVAGWLGISVDGCYD